MKRYQFIWILGLIALLLFPISCNHYDGGSDELTMVTVNMTVENQNQSSASHQFASDQGPQQALAASVNTVMILVVPESATSADIAIGMTHLAKALMTVADGKVTLTVPLDTPLRLVQLAFNGTYTLEQLISQTPWDDFRGISSSFTVTSSDTAKTISISLSYGPAGWAGTVQLGGTAKDDVHGIGIDGNNNIYMAGHTYADIEGVTLTSTEDLLVVKYNSAGIRQSLLFFYADTPSQNFGTDIAVDSAGNQYVTGHIDGGLFGGDDFGSSGMRHGLLKIGTDGTLAWAKNIGVGQPNENQRVAVDSNGFVSTVFAETGISRFASDGTASGSNANIVAAPAIADSSTGVAVDSSGNMYVVYWDSDISTRFIKKFDTAGAEQLSGLETNVWPTDIAVDSSGNVIAVGRVNNSNVPLAGENCTGTAGGEEAYIQKFSASDFTTPTWTRVLCTSGTDEITDVKTDSSGNIYVVGTTSDAFSGETNAGVDDLFVAKFNSSGTQQWLIQHGTSGYDQADAIELDSYGFIFIGGYTDGAFPGYTNAGSYDIFLLKITNDGTLLP
jgi:hypothetical protein